MRKHIRFKNLTREQKKVICNGCGGKGSWFRPPRGVVYREMCDHHDFNYTLGGTWKDKLKADWQLCWAIWKHGWSFGEFADAGWGLLYFAGLTVGGWKFFNWHGDGATIDLKEYGF